MITPKDYGRFCVADPLFYEYPERLDDDGTALAAAHRQPPAGWESGPAGWWIRLMPRATVLPAQGWKVHVSVAQDQVAEAGEIVRGHCLDRNLPCDIVRSLAAARHLNGRDVDRFEAGRLLTVLLPTEDDLPQVLRELGVLLDGMAGPYILGTLRHGAGPLYLSYGSYRKWTCPDAAGEPVPAIRRPDGDLECEPRRAVFSLPEWVTPPGVLRADLAALNGKPAEQFPYRVERALHLGNGSGTYHAADTRTGEAVVLREARPHAGLDERGDDAVTRLRTQHGALTALAGLDWVPRLMGATVFAEHHFLAVERIQGDSLESLSLQFPLTSAAQSAREASGYTARMLDVLDRIDAALSESLLSGVCFKALHPRSVLVRPNGHIAVVDFASVTDVQDTRPSALGEEEFAAPAGLQGAAAHTYLVNALRLWLFMPLPYRQPTKLPTLTHTIEQHFPVPTGFGASLLAGLRPAGDTSQEDPAAALLAARHHDWPAVRDSIVAGIHATATPGRTDRLFPGSPTWHKTLGGHAFDHGAAGVLYALHRAGVGVPAEYVAWLVAAAERDPDPRPGLYDGLHGVALTLDVLGHRDHALAILDRCRKLPGAAEDLPPGLASGTAGIALNLLRFAAVTADGRLLEAAVRMADGLGDLVRRGPLAERRGDPPPYGLLHGTAGAALLFLRLHKETGQSRYLDLADLALRHDLARCRTLSDGTVMLNDGVLGLPYLHGGSMGLAFPLLEYLRHRDDPGKASVLAAIRSTCEPVYVRNAGLLRGRAGVVATLAALDGPQDTPAISTQIRRLAWHAQHYRGHLAWPGFRMHRLSADLATGSAGVLLALGSAFERGEPALPYLGPRDSTEQPVQRR
ncbi:class III lanthionine synthetase LanKC [Streptomyces sp. NPDC051642]|uniref:class III lanthionine synthetase LanKC n=1 Tax=Streptomyces sp. NPDC051642 TaxID=3154646 RepID=UPI00342B3D9E